MAQRLRLASLSPDQMAAMTGFSKSLAGHSLDDALLELVKVRASQLNGCAYCIALHVSTARKLGETNDRLHLLNASATIIWACCDGSGTLDEIAHDLAEIIGIPAEQLASELVSLVRALGAEGLLNGVAPRDPVTFAGAAVAIVAIALAASWLPARRAGAVNGSEVFAADSGS